ncbi:hypothetical protein CUTER_05160 [Corynebacterium uterequi]|uniref:Tetratrico peptide repeat group 5 domain-containing protein n=2 Tax=Corynebacterium uterequi TaxID=1072256 RepID=A0A0G3HE61_9CORY|nr:hypothetical protein CUTER_05160 [Corynebacterium uterequi]
MELRSKEPALPDNLDVKELDPMIRQDLRVLSKDNAEAVAKHMLAAMEFLEEDPERALQHARAAKNRGGRVAVAREVNGIAAYHAGEWKEALSELRAARRMSGGPGLLAVMADCERGLGRPEKAIEMARTDEARSLDADSRVELGIVVAGARRDLEQFDAAVVTLERFEPSTDGTSETDLRLAYAYADALVAAGRPSEARPFFVHVAECDLDDVTDAALRIAELDNLAHED